MAEVLAIIRNLPLRRPSILTARGLKRIETGTERLTDEAVDKWKPISEEEAALQ